MTSLRTLTVILACALSVACQREIIKDESSPLYSVTSGSRLVLQRDLLIPAEHVSVYMQNGEILTIPVLDQYRPHCKFEVKAMQEYARTVSADTFIIIDVIDEIESVSLSGMRYASLWHASDTPAIYTYTTRMMLSSERQADVLRMSCMHWESIRDDNYLSISQMRRAMGDIFTLHLKQ